MDDTEADPDLVEEFATALQQAHHADWDMETVREAAWICARTMTEIFERSRAMAEPTQGAS